MPLSVQRASRRPSHSKHVVSFDPVSRGAKPGINHVQLFKERVLAITADTKVAVLHDTDADGICSGVLVAKAVERLRAKPVDHVVYQAHKNVGINQDTIQFLKKKGVTLLFTVDKAVDEDPQTVKEASQHLRWSLQVVLRLATSVSFWT